MNQNTVYGHREGNKCNDIGYVHIACSELPCPAKKFKQVCVSKLLSAKKEKKWEPGVSF